MAVVIGSATTVSISIPIGLDGSGGNFTDFCVVSINWGFNPNVQRYYCLGSSTPAYSISKPTESLSFVVYTPYGITDPRAGDVFYDLAPSEDCTTQNNTITATVDAAVCVGVPGEGPISTVWYLNNYGFSKDDANLPGQETWALTAYPTEDLDGNSVTSVIPDAIIRGISEGQATAGDLIETPYDHADPGVVFDAAGLLKASTGNVQAGGVGKIDHLLYGTATSVGASSNLPDRPSQFGRTGQGSVSVPQNPVWF